MARKDKLFDYLLQLIMVVVGVFLGMMASEHNLNRKVNQDKNKMLIGLKKEMENNMEYLVKRKQSDLIPFFNSLDSLTKATKGKLFLKEYFKDKSFVERVPNFPGLGRPRLDDAMFETAKYANILSHYDLEILSHITQTYTMQYNMQNAGDYMQQKLAQIDSKTIYEDVIDLMWDIMQDYFGAQYKLIDMYKTTILKVENSIN